jgi:hypothetical protein
MCHITKCVMISLFLIQLIFYLCTKEAGTEGGKSQLHFEEVLKSNIAIYVVCSFIDRTKLCMAKYCLSHFLNLFGGTPKETKKHINLDLGVIFLSDCLTISYFINKLTMNYH